MRRFGKIRVEANFLYGWVPESNLVGGYIPNQCPGLQLDRIDAYEGKYSCQSVY